MAGTATARRWLGVGSSDGPDAQAAGLSASLGATAGRDASIVVVFASDTYDLPRLIGSVSEATQGAPMIGCSTAGEIATSGPGASSVVVVALGGEGFSVSTGCGVGGRPALRDAAAEAAACADLVAADNRALLLLSDGLAGDQQEVVRGAYGVVGAGVPLVGGCAGDDMRMVATHQFHDGAVVTDSVVAACIGSDSPMGIGVKHGWRNVGGPMMVTSSDGNRVFTLDDRPALDVYLERLSAPEAARNDAEALTQFAMVHPLGLKRRSTEEVRFVAGGDFEERSLQCIAAVPQGGLTWLMQGDDDSILRATDDACRAALAPLDGRTPIGLVAFDCIARKGVLGDEGIRREVGRIAAHAGGAPVAGFYTYGEFARTRGTGGFHNQTLVVLAVS